MALRDITQFHENAAAVAWWRARLGPALIWLAPPARRRTILSMAAIGVGSVSAVNSLAKVQGLSLAGDAPTVVLVVLAQFALLWLVYLAAQRFAGLPALVRRHPQWALHGSYWSLLLLLWVSAPATAGAWRAVVLGLAVLYPVLIWRCGYLLLAGQHARMAGTRITDHLFYLWPAYGGSNTPYGKGLAYLSQCEAKTADELARSQLAGLKLFALALLWRLVLTGYEGVLYGPGNGVTRALGGFTLALPTLPALLPLGAQAPTALAWASIYGELFEQVLRLAIKGHLIVGMLRLFGFNVFRNTYKPLLAESIVEFWNRYFYYFKELLVTFFFLPTFTGVGKRLRRWPALRLFAAVFAAAFVGNVYYHVIHDAAPLAQLGLGSVLEHHQSRTLYCLLLACGLFVSMWREQDRRGAAAQAWRAPRALRIFGVWSFFGLITIWNADGGASFGSRLGFFGGLFGLA